MNVAKIMHRALTDANVIRSDSTTPRILTQPDLLSWVEEGTDILEKALRNARVDYMIVTRQTSDSAFIWDGETYTPNSTSTMSLINTTTAYSLPPDLLRLRRIRSVSTGDEDIEFEAKDIAHQDMIDLQQATNPQRQILYFDVIGDRILFIPNAPTGTIQVEISYIARSRKPDGCAVLQVAMTRSTSVGARYRGSAARRHLGSVGIAASRPAGHISAAIRYRRNIRMAVMTSFALLLP